jgi:hypothetical protein
MKRLIILTVLVFGYLSTQAQQGSTPPMIINSEVKIDSVGNALFEMSGKLTGTQWQNWNAAYGGGNASMVKRGIERSLSSSYVYDFQYIPNEMERSFVIKYKAKGVVKYLGKDKWLAELGMKDTQPIKIGENACSFVSSQLNGYSVLQINGKATFPAQITGMTFDKDEFNNIVVKYQMPTESLTTVGNQGFKTIGYSLLGLAGFMLAGLIFFRKKLS